MTAIDQDYFVLNVLHSSLYVLFELSRGSPSVYVALHVQLGKLSADMNVSDKTRGHVNLIENIRTLKSQRIHRSVDVQRHSFG